MPVRNKRRGHDKPRVDMETIANESASPDNVREIRITPGLSPEDVETILTMAASSGLFSADAMMSAEDMAWDSAYGDGGEQHTFLLARTNEAESDTIVGFLCFGPIPHWRGEYELYGIAVAPEYQRLGIGSGLVAEMMRCIAGLNGKRIFLETGGDQPFENTRRFYEANGFVFEHRFRKQFIPLEGGVVYCLDITTGESAKQYQ